MILVMVKRVIGFVVGIALGVGFAMLIGWVLFPLERQEITPASMRPDYQTEYLRLVALAYQADGDLVLAKRRLRAVAGDAVSAPVVALTERWIDDARDADLIVPLIALAQALDAETPAMIDYLYRGER